VSYQADLSDPRGLSRSFAAAVLLGLQVRIPPGTWISVSCVYSCVSASGLSLVQRSPTKRGVSECGFDA